jgi:hypothetical protein
MKVATPVDAGRCVHYIGSCFCVNGAFLFTPHRHWRFVYRFLAAKLYSPVSTACSSVSCYVSACKHPCSPCSVPSSASPAQYDYEPAPLIVGLVLGPVMERSLRQTLIISKGNLNGLWESPLCMAMCIVIVAAAAFPFATHIFRKKMVT